jgi:hypothetical protein
MRTKTNYVPIMSEHYTSIGNCHWCLEVIWLKRKKLSVIF